jgi:hypothetical protein
VEGAQPTAAGDTVDRLRHSLMWTVLLLSHPFKDVLDVRLCKLKKAQDVDRERLKCK